jgi:hypothetical protein
MTIPGLKATRSAALPENLSLRLREITVLYHENQLLLHHTTTYPYTFLLGKEFFHKKKYSLDSVGLIE